MKFEASDRIEMSHKKCQTSENDSNSDNQFNRDLLGLSGEELENATEFLNE